MKPCSLETALARILYGVGLSPFSPQNDRCTYQPSKCAPMPADISSAPGCCTSVRFNKLDGEPVTSDLNDSEQIVCGRWA